MKRMFFGAYQENFSIIDPKSENGSIKKTKKTELEFNSLLLTVPDSKSQKDFSMEIDLYDLIDESLVEQMDYRDEDKETKAQKTKWFKVLPQVIVFQQNVLFPS